MRVGFASYRLTPLEQGPLGSLGVVAEAGKGGRQEECLEAACAQFFEESPFCSGIDLARSSRPRSPSGRILMEGRISVALCVQYHGSLK